MVKLFAKRPRRELSEKDKRNITLMRYGSTSEFNQILHTMPEISKRLSIHYTTVATFLYRLRDKGARAIGNCRYRPEPKPIGSRDIELILLSDKYLTKWAGLTMRTRA